MAEILIENTEYTVFFMAVFYVSLGLCNTNFEPNSSRGVRMVA